MLYPVVHDLRSPLSHAYAAVSALAGTPTSNALRLERNVSGRRDPADPMPNPVLFEILAALRFSIEHLLGYIRPASFRRFVHYNGPALIPSRGAVIVTYRRSWLRSIVIPSSPGAILCRLRSKSGRKSGELNPPRPCVEFRCHLDDQAREHLGMIRTADFASQDVLADTLRRHGDFLLWELGIVHRAFGVLPACILTVRWSLPR